MFPCRNADPSEARPSEGTSSVTRSAHGALIIHNNMWRSLRKGFDAAFQSAPCPSQGHTSHRSWTSVKETDRSTDDAAVAFVSVRSDHQCDLTDAAAAGSNINHSADTKSPRQMTCSKPDTLCTNKNAGRMELAASIVSSLQAGFSSIQTSELMGSARGRMSSLSNRMVLFGLSGLRGEQCHSSRFRDYNTQDKHVVP